MLIRVWHACLAVAVVVPLVMNAPGGSACAGEPATAVLLPSQIELPPVPTLGGMQFWADELFFHQWRIQRNVITGHCRLLDGKDLLRRGNLQRGRGCSPAGGRTRAR